MKKIKPPKLSASSRQNNKLQDGSRRLKNGGARPINGLVAENGENEDGEENFAALKIEENGHVKDKPCFLIHSQQVIKSNPAFGHKKLCDGLTFTAGHACAFSCAYCYVPASLARNKRILAIKRNGDDLRSQDFVVEIANAPVIAREYLTVGGDLKTPRFDDPSDKRVIFASPLVDVAGRAGLRRFDCMARKSGQNSAPVGDGCVRLGLGWARHPLGGPLRLSAAFRARPFQIIR